MNVEFVAERITQLRLKKGVSEYRMSRELGHSRSYIQNIVSGRSKPSLEELFYICEYLGVTPKDFFDEENEEAILVQRAAEGLRKLNDRDLLMLIGLIDRLGEQDGGTRR